MLLSYPSDIALESRSSQPERPTPPVQRQAGSSRPAEFAIRDQTIEESFRDDKRHGWQWEASRVTDPDRASRLLLVLHLASLWCLSAGAAAVQAGRAARWIRPARPAWSLFRLGWTWLRHALRHPEPVPLHHRLPHLPTWRTPLPYALSPRHACP